MSASLLSSAFSAFSKCRALVIGDLMLDAYLYGETVRVSREAPVLVVRKERVDYRLGGAANTAQNLAALGLRTEIIGVLGNDESAVKLSELLTASNVTANGVVAPFTTPKKTRILAGAFGTSRQQVLRVDEEPEAHYDAATIGQLVEKAALRVGDFDVVVISDYGLGTVTQQLAVAAQKWAAMGKLVCVDSRYRLEWFRGVTAVTPNVPEAESLVGYSLNNDAAVERAGTSILQKLDCQACLITRGRGGMTMFRPRMSSCHVNIVGSDEVTDVTGAGDTVMATFSAALAAGLGYENAMRLANVAAGIVVMKLGAAVASPQEISAHFQRYDVQLATWGN